LDLSLQADVLRYTDDTQLTMALAEHLCVYPRVDQAALVTTFLDHFDGGRGYARGMFGVVAAWERGEDHAAAATSVFGEGSFGNGAAMRVAPVGLLWREDPDTLREAAVRSAAITHAHPIGTDAATAQARAVAQAATSGSFTVADLERLAAEARTEQLRATLTTAARVARNGSGLTCPDVAEAIGTGVVADQSVAAALWVAATAEDFEHAVLLALALGGDVDTIAAMACAVTGAGVTDAAIPTEWLDRLEDDDRGRRYAVALAERLAAVRP
jgi:poly(ADP-ribose) glycohydrolase ARH3